MPVQTQLVRMRRKRNDMDFTRGHVKVSPRARKGSLGANGAQVHVDAQAQRVGALNCIVDVTVLETLPSLGPAQLQGPTHTAAGQAEAAQRVLADLGRRTQRLDRASGSVGRRRGTHPAAPPADGAHVPQGAALHHLPR